MTAPATPNEVAIHLSRLGRDLATMVSQLEAADLDATEKRAAYDLAFSRAFIAATGAVDQRKHLAVVEVHRQRLEADVADAVVRHLKRRVDELKVRIEIGRSYGAAIRAELNLAQMGVD